MPYAVRNILAHSGHNPNTLDANGNELRTAVDLLRQWTGKARAKPGSQLGVIDIGDPKPPRDLACGDSWIRRLVDSAREPVWGATPGLESTA